MQIQLKQAEIVAALKQYVANQGISLNNKEVTISFTAGRKQSGISADIVISEVDIPGFTDSDTSDDADSETAQETKLSLSVVSAKVTPIDELKAAIEEPPAQEAEPAPKKTTSLFS